MATRTEPAPTDMRLMAESAIDLLLQINATCDVLMSTNDYDDEGKKVIEIPARSFGVLMTTMYQQSKEALECIRPITDAIYTAHQVAHHR